MEWVTKQCKLKMLYDSTKEPKYRIKKFFLFFPYTQGCVTKWLCWTDMKQELYKIKRAEIHHVASNGYHYYWRNIEWIS